MNLDFFGPLSVFLSVKISYIHWHRRALERCQLVNLERGVRTYRTRKGIYPCGEAGEIYIGSPSCSSRSFSKLTS